MVKYEYKCVMIIGDSNKTSELLNKYGNEGWELVSVWNTWHYFKRELRN
ncbi:DUF4177 domain-containing protein [Romboutsia lituseburensis]|nr:DUF4177 domain-containing protein [Romboutsia lituseburensis]